MPEVRLGSLKSGRVVCIGEEAAYLDVGRRGQRWSFSLRDMRSPPIVKTSWVTLDRPELLRTSPHATIIRDELTRFYPEAWRRILDAAIGVIQESVGEWPVTEIQEEVGAVVSGIGPGLGSGEAGDAGEEVKKPSLSTEEDAEITAILDSSTPLEKMKPLLNDVAAGETENKQLGFTLLTSSKSGNPREREMILLKGRAGVGKTTLIDALTKAFKTKVVGRFSEHALDYSDLAGYEILYLKEVGHMDEEEQGVSTLKFLSADDQGYTVEVTVGSPQEGFTTVTRRIPPMTVVSSTTRVELDPQFERRCWIMYLDESPEQTSHIMDWIAKQETEELEVALGIRAELSRDRAQRLLHALVEEVTPCHVTVLFPRTLLRILEQSKLRVRGDFGKLMRMLKYYGRLRQRTLPKIKGHDGRDIVLMTPQAALDILKVAWEPLTLMMLELDKRTEKLLDGFEAMGWKEKGATIPPDKRAELAMKMGYASDTVYRYLNDLEKVNLLSSDGKRPKTYHLLESLKSIRQKGSALSGKLDNPDDFILEMCREALKTLETLSGKLPEGSTGDMRQYFTPDDAYAPAHPSPSYPDSHLGQETPQKPEIRQKEPDYPEPRMIVTPLPDVIRGFLEAEGGSTTILRLQAHLEREGYSLEDLTDELARLQRQGCIIVTLKEISLGPEWRKPPEEVKPSPTDGTGVSPPPGGTGEEAAAEEEPEDATPGSHPEKQDAVTVGVGLFADAERILRAHGGHMLQQDLFTALMRLGYNRIQADQILRDNPRFVFRGLTVTLMEVE